MTTFQLPNMPEPELVANTRTASGLQPLDQTTTSSPSSYAFATATKISHKAGAGHVHECGHIYTAYA